MNKENNEHTTSNTEATNTSPEKIQKEEEEEEVVLVQEQVVDKNEQEIHMTPGAYHAMSEEQVKNEFSTDLVHGLSSQEAAQRLVKYGRNKLSETKKETFLHKVWRQLNSILIFVLLVAAIVSGALLEWAEFALILIVVFLNVCIGLYQEGKAEKSSEALKNMLSSKATVFRDGERKSVNAEEVVPGDIVFVESGDRVPADIRLISVINLNVDESMLTGESLAVKKNLHIVKPDSALGDRKCMSFSATLVTKGQARGICVKTGDDTEIGKIKSLVDSVGDSKTELTIQLEVFGRWIAAVTLPVALISFLLSYFTGAHAGDAADAFTEAVAVAVAIIPEGLPAVLTITLSIGMSYMAKNNAIVRVLPCVETLGSVMVICSDKTGTLTKNEMTAVGFRLSGKSFTIKGVGYDPSTGSVECENSNEQDMNTLKSVIVGGLLCNESLIDRVEMPAKGDMKAYTKVVPVGDPTEVAIVTLGEKIQLFAKELRKENPRVGAIPFESEHKFMATIHKNLNATSSSTAYVAYFKGAPDRLVLRCNQQLTMDGSLEPIDTKYWQDAATEYSSRGLRCLALARAFFPEDTVLEDVNVSYVLSKEPFLVMCGLVAIMDPPRDECIAAIKECHTAGITVKMITGDHPATARAIGDILGLVDMEHSDSITGPELDKLSPDELAKFVMGCNIFARASPENKIQIVQALKANKQVCSMTGDGVNDAPALRAANIGVAMGITGTDVSKEAAKIVLADDNFATIVLAVREGRRVWDNLRKILIFNQPVNFAQGLGILWALIVGLSDSPLSAIQILYVNLVTSVTLGLMLAFEPCEDNIMTRPPRRVGKRLVGKMFLWRVCIISSLMIVFMLGAWQWCFVLGGYTVGQLRAIAMTTLIFMECAYALNCRYLSASCLHPRVFRGNSSAIYCSLFMMLAQVFLVYVPKVNEFFSMEPMDGPQWGIVFLFTFALFFIVEFEKWFTNQYFREYIRPTMRKIEYTFCCLKCISCVQCGKSTTGKDLPKDLEAVVEHAKEKAEHEKSNPQIDASSSATAAAATTPSTTTTTNNVVNV